MVVKKTQAAMVVEDTRPNWTEKYLGSDHHTDRLMRTVVGLEDESCVRHHWYEDSKWPVYNKAQVRMPVRRAERGLQQASTLICFQF